MPAQNQPHKLVALIDRKGHNCNLDIAGLVLCQPRLRQGRGKRPVGITE